VLIQPFIVDMATFKNFVETQPPDPLQGLNQPTKGQLWKKKIQNDTMKKFSYRTSSSEWSEKIIP